MRKGLKPMIWAGLVCLLMGCGQSAAPAGSSAGQSGSSSASVPSTTGSLSPLPEVSSNKSTGGIDVDLTTLSSTMVYAEVYNMMTAPKDYIGKTVKMAGNFSYFQDENTGKEYFACIVQDATACCAQGIEFELSGSHKYPDDYPKKDAMVCVIGEFDTYIEGDSSYCTLRNARFADK